jgi:serine/threonine-protein kinase
VHKEILMWEGRSAFDVPYKGLEEAYAAASEAVHAWLAAKKDEQKVGEQAEIRDREVADLEFQIHELRAALANLEHNVEDEKTKSEKRIADLDTETEALQVELLALATRFCAPLRRRPELGPLFQELEADAAA